MEEIHALIREGESTVINSHELPIFISVILAISGVVLIDKVKSEDVVSIGYVEDYRCETFVSNGMFEAYVDPHDFHHCKENTDAYFNSVRAIYPKSDSLLSVIGFSGYLDVEIKKISSLRDHFPVLDQRNDSIIPYLKGTELMIDTGGSNTIIFTDRKDDEYEEYLDNSSASGRITLLSGYSNFEVQGITIQGVIEHPIKGINSEIIGDEVAAGSGQLGIDFFYSLKNVCLDFERSLLRSTCEDFTLGDRYGIELYKRGSRLYVPLIVNNRRVMAFIDTGSFSSIMVSKLCHPRYDFEAVSIFGGVSSYKASVLLFELDFQEYSVGEHAALCVHSETQEFDSWILGGNFFNRFSYVEFDFHNGKMFLGVKQ